MWYSSDSRPQKDKLKQQSSSKSAMESAVFPQSKPCPRNLDKLKTNSVIVDPCHNKAAKPDTLGEIFQRESVKESSTQRDEELVKYMSNLPGFLKRSDRGKNIQEKALNVGVLDWSQLEKWKNKQSHIPAVTSNFTSFNSGEESSSRAATATTSSTTARGHKRPDDKKGLHSSRIKGSHKEALPKSSKLSSQNVKQYQHCETEEKIIGGEQRMKPWEFESIGKTQLESSLQKEKRSEDDKITSIVGNFPSKSRLHGVSLVPNENPNGRDIEAKSMQGLQQHGLKKKERNLNSSSDKGLPSLELKNKGISFGSQKKMSSRSNEAKIKMDQWQESDIDVGKKQCHGMPRNIVLLRPRKFLQSSFEDYFQPSQSMISSDEIFSESNQSSSSYISLPEVVHTGDAYSETLHSSALPSVTGLASSSETTQHSVNTDLEVDHSPVISKKPGCSNKMSSLQYEDTCIEKDALHIKLRNQGSFSNLKESKDHETAELIAERTSNNSSQRWLSSGLNRIGRSLSFKEGSTLPKLSSMYVSTKSGPLTSESSTCLDNSRKDRVNGHNRSRSSPLRRLLDPIWRHKASSTRHSDQSSVTSQGSMNSISFRTSNLHAEKSKESSIQALLQLTIKNGVPLFKFVLNSERKVLAATMKSSASPHKDDGSCYFTFYLVNEIKKKSGKWKSYWSKDKNCGYAYNIVGQMKISSSKTTESSDQNFKRQCMVKDYVLFGVGFDQTDQGPPEFTKSRELAAAVIEIPCENASHEGLHSINLMKKECLKCLLADERCFCISQGNDISGSIITVILPGGAHSSPNKGEPSPLIHRWKMGGSCDCGGWDIGCKLLVLSNQNPSSNIPRSSKPHVERFQLFVQVSFYFSA